MIGTAKDIIKWLLNKDTTTEYEIKEHRGKRSLNANNLMWQCLGEMAVELQADKWDLYLLMLKRYGKFTYILVKPNMVDAVKRQWRETEEIGEIDINGQKSVQLLCYFGSSTLDSKEFSVLLSGVISEMAEMGLDTPSDKKLNEALKQWEKKNDISRVSKE